MQAQTGFQATAGYPAQQVPSGSCRFVNQGPPPQAQQQPAQQVHGQLPAMSVQPSSTTSSGPVLALGPSGQSMTYNQPQMQMGQLPQQKDKTQHMRPVGYPQQGPSDVLYSQPQQMGPLSQSLTSDAQEHPAYYANQPFVEHHNVECILEAAEFQQTVHRNVLMYWASLADGGQSQVAQLQAQLDENMPASSQQNYQPAVPTEYQVVTGDKENRSPQMLNPEEQTSFQASAEYPAQPVPSGSYYTENQGPPPQAHQQPAQQTHGQPPAILVQQMQQQQHHPQQQILQQRSSTISSSPVPGVGQPMAYSQSQLQMGQSPQQQYYPQQYQQQTGSQPPQSYQSQQDVRTPSQQQQNDPAAMVYGGFQRPQELHTRLPAMAFHPLKRRLETDDDYLAQMMQLPSPSTSRRKETQRKRTDNIGKSDKKNSQKCGRNDGYLIWIMINFLGLDIKNSKDSKYKPNCPTAKALFELLFENCKDSKDERNCPMAKAFFELGVFELDSGCMHSLVVQPGNKRKKVPDGELIAFMRKEMNLHVESCKDKAYTKNYARATVFKKLAQYGWPINELIHFKEKPKLIPCKEKKDFCVCAFNTV